LPLARQTNIPAFPDVFTLVPPGASVRGVEQQQLPMQHHSSFAIAH